MIFIGYVYKYIPATRVTFRGNCTREATFQVGLALSLITVPILEGEARVRGQLAYDYPDVAMV